MYVYRYVSVHVYLHVYPYVYIYIYRVYVYVYAIVHVRVYVHVYVHVLYMFMRNPSPLIQNVLPNIYDPACRVLVLGSPSKVVLASPSCGVLIAICIGSFSN